MAFKKTGIKVGIDFELNKNAGDLHIDFMALMLDEQGKLVSNSHFIFYNNPNSPDGSVEHLGVVLLDSNDHEEIIVEPEKIDRLVRRIIFFVNIHQAAEKKQSFGQVNHLRLRMTNLATRTDLAEFVPDRDKYYLKSTLVVLAELACIDNEWQIAALGDCYRVSLDEFIDLLSTDFGYEKFKQEYFKFFKGNETDYSPVRSVIEKETEERYYRILGCKSDSSDDELKKKYKELVKGFHPDVIQSKGLHPDIVEFAASRFKEIKEAFDFIRAKRKL
jgi:tellurium resistance protein TerD